MSESSPIELAPNIYYVPGKQRSRFPYCACLYVKGQKLRVLVDAGMGRENLEQVREMGIDVLMLTHSHVDHRLTRKYIPDVPVWCHELEEQFVTDKNRFFQGVGFFRCEEQASGFFDKLPGVFDVNVDRRFNDGDEIDLGGLTLRIIHAPGHTPGHMAVYIPERKILFTGDVDLSSWGPFYGHDYANVTDFIASIRRLREVDFETVATGHAGAFDRGEALQRFQDYENVIYRRESDILDKLDQPRSIEDLLNRNLIYTRYPEPKGLIPFFEQVHIEKNLARMASQGRVVRTNGVWVKS